MQHVDGGDLWIDAELLRQIAEDPANFVFLLENIEAVEIDSAGIGILQSSDGSHQCAFARAVRTEQTEHIIADCEGEILKRFNAVRIGFRQISYGKCQGGVSLQVLV